MNDCWAHTKTIKRSRRSYPDSKREIVATEVHRNFLDLNQHEPRALGFQCSGVRHPSHAEPES